MFVGKNFYLLMFVLLVAICSGTVYGLEETILYSSDNEIEDWFGNAVSIDGQRALVGAWGEDELGDRAGAAYIFEQQLDGSWVEQAKLVASDGVEGDHFGFSVSLDGDYALIGAVYDDDGGTSSGAAYIFERQGDGSWLEEAKLVASDPEGYDYFGREVSLDGDYALIGKDGDEELGHDAGAAYVFERQGDGSWLEEAKLVASDGAEDDEFGKAVSLDEGYAVIGARYNDIDFDDQGSVYVFERQDDGSWDEQQRLVASDPEIYDYFGISVSIHGDWVFVGVSWDDDLGDKSGSVYAFEKQLDGMWTEHSKLNADDSVEQDRFGDDVGVYGDYAIIGASYETEDVDDAGAAYIFKYEEGSWSQIEKIIASDAQRDDKFGNFVSITEGYVIVGTDGDIVGDFLGSAYIYKLFDVEIEGIELTTTDLIAGEEGTLTVTGAEPGEDVIFLRGSSGRTCLGPICVDLSAPKIISTEIADGDGIATLSLPIPLSAAGREVTLQAVVRRGVGGEESVVSNVVVEEVMS